MIPFRSCYSDAQSGSAEVGTVCIEVDLPGTPDLVFSTPKVAVFVDSDFWHGRVPEDRLRKMSEYWQRKLESNRKRDARTNQQLSSLGWKVLRFGEREVRRDAGKVAERVLQVVKSKGSDT